MKKIIYLFINHLAILVCISCGSHQSLQQSSFKNKRITPDYVPHQIAAIQRELSIMAENGMENSENYKDLEEQLQEAIEEYKKFSEIAYREFCIRSKSNAYINNTPTEPYSPDDTLILEEVHEEEEASKKGFMENLLSMFK